MPWEMTKTKPIGKLLRKPKITKFNHCNHCNLPNISYQSGNGRLVESTTSSLRKGKHQRQGVGVPGCNRSSQRPRQENCHVLSSRKKKWTKHLGEPERGECSLGCEYLSLNIQNTHKLVCHHTHAKTLLLRQDSKQGQNSRMLAGHIPWYMQDHTREIQTPGRWKARISS